VQGVHAPELGDGRLNHLGHLALVGDIDTDADRFAAVGTNAFGDGLSPVFSMAGPAERTDRLGCSMCKDKEDNLVGGPPGGRKIMVSAARASYRDRQDGREESRRG
jgi:hypothetical protein